MADKENLELITAELKGFYAGRSYQMASRNMVDAWRRLKDIERPIAERLVSYQHFEFNYEDLKKINAGATREGGYLSSVDSAVKPEGITLFRTAHEELCYEDIELMRKSGELEKLNIKWGGQR